LKQNYLFCEARPKGAGPTPLLGGIFLFKNSPGRNGLKPDPNPAV